MSMSCDYDVYPFDEVTEVDDIVQGRAVLLTATRSVCDSQCVCRILESVTALVAEPKTQERHVLPIDFLNAESESDVIGGVVLCLSDRPTFVVSRQNAEDTIIFRKRSELLDHAFLLLSRREDTFPNISDRGTCDVVD